MARTKTRVTAVVLRGEKLLLIHRFREGKEYWIFPGGVEEGEDLETALRREVLEETGYSFQPDALTGIYHWTCAENGTTYLRFTFSGQVTDFDPTRKLDTGIVRATWFSMEEILEKQAIHRTPLVIQCITDYLAEKNYPLDILKYYS